MTQDELAQKLFVTRQTVSNYENGKSRPDVEMLDRIAQMLETDIVTLIYGPTAKKIPGVVFACGAAVVVGILLLIANANAGKLANQSFEIGMLSKALFILGPMYFVFLGWLASGLIGLAMKWKPKDSKVLRWAGCVLAGLLVIWFLMMVLHFFRAAYRMDLQGGIRAVCVLLSYPNSALFDLSVSWCSVMVSGNSET